MTSYEARVHAVQRAVLDALRQHAEPDKAARQLVRTSFPAALAEAGEDRGAAATFRPLAQQDRDLLGAGLAAAAAALSAASTEARTQVMAYRLDGGEQPAVAALVDAVLWLCQQQPAPLDVGVPAQLLEQVVETTTVEQCEGVFAYLDSRIAAFKEEKVFQRSNLTLLRTCNLLLKRLSKAANAPLCGRILLFLAKFLSLTERSGVNLLGTFNTENVTPVEDVQEAWFSNPPSVLEHGKWVEVSRGIRKVAITEAAPGAGGAAAADGGSSVKYLSSSRLIGLQLRDATFRRHFLLQCLVLMQYAERPRAKDKEHPERPGLRGAKLLEDLQDLRRQVYAVLEATPEHGKEFAAAVRHVMQWEDSWAAWKQAGCPREPLERAPAVPPEGAEAGSGLPPAKKHKVAADVVYGVRVGTDELDRLWNLTEDNLSCLSADDRGGFKSLHQLMDPVIEQMHEGADDAMKASKSKVYSWKTLRMVARQNLQAFSKAVQAGGDLEVAARALYPDECPPPPEPPAPAPATQPPGAAGAPSPGASGALAPAPAAADGPGPSMAAADAVGAQEEGGGDDDEAVAAEAATPAADADDGEEAAVAGGAADDGAAEEGELNDEAVGQQGVQEGHREEDGQDGQQGTEPEEGEAPKEEGGAAQGGTGGMDADA
eukprot:scaffold17.g489.t1